MAIECMLGDMWMWLRASKHVLIDMAIAIARKRVQASASENN